MVKHIISLSGGIGSYYTLKRVLEKHDKKDVICVFCYTLAEDGDYWMDKEYSLACSLTAKYTTQELIGKKIKVYE